MGRVVEERKVKGLCDKIDAVTTELTALKSLLVEDENFFRMLTLEEVEQDTRLNWMRNIFGETISDETLAFFCILMDNEDMFQFSDVLAEGLTLLGAERRGVRGVVYSAVPLKKEAIKKLEEQAAILLKKPLILANLIDESLIGGVLISVDGKLIDASIKKRIEDLSLRISSNTEGGDLL